jgi:hypothetical protein
MEDIENLEQTIKENKITKFDPICIRKKSNMSKSTKTYKFDTEGFSPESLLNNMKRVSPKLHVLLQNIKKLDAKDRRQHGKVFKHFIFSDLKSNSAGATLLASALVASGYHMSYTAKPKEGGKKKYETLTLLSHTDLEKTKYENLSLLSSGGVYDQSISVATKKQILQTFNQRPENIGGELVRFMVMDSGFKEGIDLFDIKYVHIFEPSVVAADQKQVIGRGTRTCGQKGLEFHPTQGWPLHVFIYDLTFLEEMKKGLLDTSSAMELYLKSMNMDIRQLHFSHDLEKTCVVGSVDYELNKNVHLFSIPDEETEEDLPEGAEFLYGGAKRQTLRVRMDLPPLIVNTREDGTLEILFEEGKREHRGHEETKEFIKERFSHFAWDPVKMENLCAEKQAGGGTVITYTPTQDFVRHYFTPENPLKGMLLWHSVGTGKTCTAIATATSTFEKEKYTILWVTRTTLKNDIWKNMFDQVCNEDIRERMAGDAFEIPADMKKRIKLLSKSWRIRPMSYKQFSNLVAKKNAFYKTLVKINGPVDPLRKTLLIIDEAHKLYGGGLSSIEQPDMVAFHNALMNSYRVSGSNSVKLLLMTATPIARQPMEMIQLINLFKLPNDQMASTFENFQPIYLKENGEFSEEGRERFLDEIAGHISYLNREKDARQFAQPILHKVDVPIAEDMEEINTFDKAIVRQYIESDIEGLKQKIVENNATIDSEIAEIDKNSFKYLKEICSDKEPPKMKKQCEKIVRSAIQDLVDEIKEEMKRIKETTKQIREQIKERVLFKRTALSDIANNRKTFEAAYQSYKETPYFQIKSKCGKTSTLPNELRNTMKEHPTVIAYDARVQQLNEQIERSKEDLKQAIQSYKGRIQELKKTLKTDLSELEKNVIRLILKEEKKMVRGVVKTKRKETTVAINRDKKEIKQTMKLREKVYKQLRKTMKKAIQEEKRNAKKIKLAEAKMRKTMRKQETVHQEFKDERIKQLIQDYSDRIEEELHDAKHEMMIEEERKRLRNEMKETAKVQKARAKEMAKEQKARDKETRKLQKALEKEEKQKAKAATKKNKKG